MHIPKRETMDTSTQLQQMQEYVARVLDQTEEFSRIEIGYNFKEHSDNAALREQAQRHIYAVLKPECSPTREPLQFLVVANADTMPGPLFAEKLAAASELGIYTTHLLYRYINSFSDPSTHGPLFRRFLHNEDRTLGADFHKPAAYRRRSLEQYSQERRNNFRILRDIEKELVPAIQRGSALYYQPPSAELAETLKRYQWGEVILKGKNGLGEYREEVSKDIKEPLEKEELSSFTLRPAAKTNHSRSSQHLLLAEIVRYKSAVDGISWEEAEVAGLK